MKIVLHVFRKDVRRHALWLLAWTVVCASPLAVLFLPDDTMLSRVTINTIAPVVRLVLFLGLVQMVVHEDALVDASAFWVTRPIGARALLAAKLLFVAVLLVLPAVAADVALIAATGLVGNRIALAIPEILLEWSLWAGAMFVLASLTSSFRGLVGAATRVIGLWLVADLLADVWPLLEDLRVGRITQWGIVTGMLRGFGADPLPILPSLAASHQVAVSVAKLAAIGVVLVVLYLTRRTVLAWATIAVALIGVTQLSALWRWDFLGPAGGAETAASSTLPAIHLSLDPTGRRGGSTEHEVGGESTGMQTVYGRVVTSGLPAPLAARVERIAGDLTFADGTKFHAYETSTLMGGTWSPEVIESLLEGARFVNLEEEEAHAMPIFNAPIDDYRRHAGQAGRLDVTTTVTVGRSRVTAQLPVRIGSRYEDGSVTEILTSIHTQDGECHIGFRETQVSLLLAPSPSVHRRIFFLRFNPDVIFVLRNRRRGEAFWPQDGSTVGFGWPTRTRVDEIMLMVAYRDPSPRRRIDDAWLADADLVRIEAEPIGSVEERIVVPAFTIPAPDDQAS
jgi:hypothetical protein